MMSIWETMHAVQVRTRAGHWRVATLGKSAAIFFRRRDAWAYARELRKHVGQVRTKPVLSIAVEE